MHKSIIIANWKLNPGTASEARLLFSAVKKGVAGIRNAEVVVCPPFVYLPALSEIRRAASLGAQDCFWEDKGAYTGEVSSSMLKEFGVTHVIVGHSERRNWLGETDEMIARKIKAVLKEKLMPVLCVGERERDSSGDIPVVVEEQICAALSGLKKGEFKNGIIAYEPVWAIGTGRPDTPDDAARAAIFIRKIVKKVLGKTAGEGVRIIYGGSVNAKNAASFILKDIRGMEGMLVGGASLKADEFVQIVKSISEI